MNIIIHSAATVRFDEHLGKAVHINIAALQYMLKLAKELKNLKVNLFLFIYYSRAGVLLRGNFYLVSDHQTNKTTA